MSCVDERAIVLYEPACARRVFIEYIGLHLVARRDAQWPMEVNPSNTLQPDAISLLNEAFSCPRWARRIDVRPFTRLPVQRLGRPKHDFVDALRGHLFCRAGIDAAGSESKLIRHATLAWDLDPETAGKQIRAYARGEACPSKGKQLRLVKALPNVEWVVEWPWEALYFRRLKAEPAEFGHWRRKQFDIGSSDVFWSALIAFRDSIDSADAEDLVLSTLQLIHALDAFVKHPIVGLRKIEFIDLVSRILCALPAFLMPKYFSLSFALKNQLTEAERRAVLFINDEDWDSCRIFLRYIAAVAVHGNMGGRPLDVERQAWDFMTHVQEQNKQFDGEPFPGMFSDEGLDDADNGNAPGTSERG